MARFYGKVGFIRTVNDGTGRFVEEEVVRYYKGDVNNNVRRYNPQNDVSANDDLALNDNVSILADAYAAENYMAMQWIEFDNVRWRITSVTKEYPRITIFFGGVWNGKATNTA